MTRDKAIEIVKSAFSAWESEFGVPNDDWSEEHEALNMAIEALKVDRPRGEWIVHDIVCREEICLPYECPNCGFRYSRRFNFCSNCGSDNRERSEE